jgi:Na+-driven multidrug efflux pump
MGPAATTGMSIANNYDGITYQFCTATSYAVMPYVSQNVGAGNVKRAVQAVGKGILLTVLIGTPVGALFAIFSGPLSSIMSSDPAVIAYSQEKMILISSLYFICGIYSVLGDALRGLGRPTAATVSTLLFMCVLRFVWVYFIYPLCPSLTFLYLVWPVGWVLSIIFLLSIMIPTVKKLKAKHAPLST